MNSKKVKATMLWYMLYRLGFHAAATEMTLKLGNADVFGVTKHGYTHEFEIKVDRGDLMRELKTIQEIKKGVFGNQSYKAGKHINYLRSFVEPAIVPNYFSFIVPSELSALCEENLKGTPYGLYVIETRYPGTGHDYFEPWCGKKANFLHKEKISDEQKHYFLRKVSMEIQLLRGREAGIKL